MPSVAFNTKRALFSYLPCLLTISLTQWAQAAAGTQPSELFQRQTGTSCLPSSSIATLTPGTSRALSTVGCAQNCARNGDCLALAHSSSQGACHLLSDVTGLTGSCSGSEATGWQTWRRASMSQGTIHAQCQNGGTEKAGGGCQCFLGYVGSYCERLMEDCKEALDSGHYNLKLLNATLTAKPSKSPDNMTLLCRGNGQTVILRQIEAHKDGLEFSWTEYVDGFSLPDDSGAFWLGLRNLYYLSISKSYKLALYIRLFNSTLVRTWYTSFKLLNDANFTAQLGPLEKGPDFLGDLNSNPFSTHDHDYGDDHYAACVMKYGGGWWFGPTCADAGYNLVGKMSTNGTNGTQDSGLVFYGSYLGGSARLLTLSLE